MSIVSQQLIGSGAMRQFRGDVTKDPFPRPDSEATAPVGFSGYTYAKDSEQNSVFGYKGGNRRGPRWNYYNTDTGEASTKYGGE